MDVSALKAKIKSKQIPHYLIFTGPEWKVQQIYIQQIAKVLGLEVVYLDSYSEVYSKIRSRTLTSSSKLFLLRDDTEIQSSDKITTQRITDSLKDNFLIHILTTTDKRKKYYKENQDRIVDFEPLSDSALKKYIKREVNLSDENCQRLIEVCEHDYGRILLEIDKINRYSIERYTEFNSGVGNDFDINNYTYEFYRNGYIDCINNVYMRHESIFRAAEVPHEIKSSKASAVRGTTVEEDKNPEFDEFMTELGKCYDDYKEDATPNSIIKNRNEGCYRIIYNETVTDQPVDPNPDH